MLRSSSSLSARRSGGGTGGAIGKGGGMNGMGGIIMKGGVAVWPAPAEGGVVVLLVPGTLVPGNED